MFFSQFDIKKFSQYASLDAGCQQKITNRPDLNHRGADFTTPKPIRSRSRNHSVVPEINPQRGGSTFGCQCRQFNNRK